MKKKQMLALALAGAMSVSTAASVVAPKMYAAETEVSLNDQIKKLAKDLAVLNYAGVGELEANLNKYTDVQKKELVSVLTEAKEVLAKKLGSYTAEEDSIIKEAAKYHEKYNITVSDSYGALIVNRKDELTKIDKVEGQAVREAQEKLDQLKIELNSIKSDDYVALGEKQSEINKQEVVLKKAQAELLEKQNALATKINEVELARHLNALVDSNKAKVEGAIAYINSKVNENEKVSIYKDSADFIAKYGEGKKAEVEKSLAAKKDEAVKKLIEEVKIRYATDVVEADITAYIDGELKDSTKKIAFDGLKDDSVFKTVENYFEELGKLANIKDTKAGLEEAKKAAAEAVEIAKEAKKAYEEATSKRAEAVKNLEIASNARQSKAFSVDYNNYKDALSKNIIKVEEHKKSLNDAEKELRTANAELKTAEEKLAKDPDNELLKSDLKLATANKAAKEKAVELAKENLDKAQKEFDRVSGLMNKFFAEFKKYNESVIKGEGELELAELKKEVEEALKDFNEFADEYQLPSISVDRGNAIKGTWAKVDGVWYYKDSKGKDIYKSAWGKINGVWYRFDENGKMLSNRWFKDTNNRWYWLASSGAMASSQWIYVDGYWFWAEGSGAITENGWVYVGNTWYYAENGGYIVMGHTWKKINSKWYHFNTSGALDVSTTTVDGYKVDANGEWIQ